MVYCVPRRNALLTCMNFRRDMCNRRCFKLRVYEPCTQFINVSQKAFHIYWQPTAMSHAIHKIVSKKSCQSYFISRRSPHHGISKDSDLCASAHRCPHYAYARLIAHVIFPLLSHTWARAHGISLPYERLRTRVHRSRNLSLP